VTDRDIDRMIKVRDIVKHEGRVWKHLTDTKMLPYLRCLTRLGILTFNIVDEEQLRMFWEYKKEEPCSD
jgi:hypothetical protein